MPISNLGGCQNLTSVGAYLDQSLSVTTMITEPAMFTYLFEACPAPGQYSAYRNHITAVQRALGDENNLIEEHEYRSANRAGWLLWFSTWTDEAATPYRSAEAAHLRRSGEPRGDSLLGYRCRAGYERLEPGSEPQPDRVDQMDGALTVLNVPTAGPPGASRCPRLWAEFLRLDTKASGLITWDIFEASDTLGGAVVLLTWKDQAAALEFERTYERPTDARIRRVYVVSDNQSACCSRGQGHFNQPEDTDQRRSLELLAESGATLGASLDLVGTVQALTDFLVPRLAAVATVDVPDNLVGGGRTGSPASRRMLRMGATMTPGHIAPAQDPRYSTPRCFPIHADTAAIVGGPRVYTTGGIEFRRDFGHDTQSSQYVRDLGIESVAVVPLSMGSGAGLGLLTLYRWRGQFVTGDLILVQELATRASMAMENSLSYMRERNTAVALRLMSMPRSVPSTHALQVRCGLSPASTDGQWFDVIRLSGARTALVVGNATYFGSSAAAAAIRLCSAVRALARLDIAPQELMTRLNDIAVDIEIDLAPSLQGRSEHNRSTCLFLVYDPTQGNLTFSSAGHQSPVVAPPLGGSPGLSDAQGPPLGQPNQKYSQTRIPVVPGTLLALSSISVRDTPTRLKCALERHGLDMDASFRAAAEVLAPSQPDSAPLIVARTSLLDADQTVAWDLPCDIAVVGTARTLAERQLDAWSIGEEATFIATLVVSELVTNAIRHASPPINLRLIKNEKLTCQVSDGSMTAPYLQYALPYDEGGRGLFIVAECVSRWGVRHGPGGKTIWTEQSLNEESLAGGSAV